MPKEENSHADTLVNLESTSKFTNKRVIPFGYIEEPRIEIKKKNMRVSKDGGR